MNARLWPLLLVVTLGCSGDSATVEPEQRPPPGTVVDADPGAPPEPPRAPFEEAVEPFILDHCLACHSSDDPTDGVALDLAYDESDVRDDWRLWRRVLREIESGSMPPRGRDRPPQDQVDRVAAWLRPVIEEQRAATPIHPGRVTLRRLTRNQYDRTVRDLFGIDFEPGRGFPADDVGYGFDSIGDVLSLPPLLLERYLDAAERVSEAAILVEDPDDPEVRTYPARDLDASARGGLRRDGARTLSTNGTVHKRLSLPRAGDYLLRVTASADRAGPDEARMKLFHGRTELHATDVSALPSKPMTVEIPFRGVAGEQVVAAAFVNDYWNPKAADPADRDRNLIVHRLEVVGPTDRREGALVQPNPAVLERTPPPGTEARALRDLARRVAEAAWRRPVDAVEVEELAAVAQPILTADEPFERAARVIVQAALVSPHFLFRVERLSAPGDEAAVEPLTPHELAVRLSYFLHGSTPDAELRRLADDGSLVDQLDAQVLRLLSDPRAQALTDDFAAQWLGLRRLADHAVDPDRFPELTPELRASMRAETEACFEELVALDRPVRSLLTNDHTFVDRRMAEHYGWDVVVPAGELVQVAYPDDATGRGLLRHASVLTLTSYSTRTSPVRRGEWVLEELIGEPPPPPPPGVGDLPEDEAALRAVSLPERLAEHRARPECAVCHDEMDTLGLALERFDPIGRHRTEAYGHPIDPVAAFPDGRTLNGIDGLVDEVLRDERFERRLTEKLLIFAIGRGLTERDEDAVDLILAEARESEFRFSALVRAVVRSPLFRLKSGEEPR